MNLNLRCIRALKWQPTMQLHKCLILLQAPEGAWEILILS